MVRLDGQKTQNSKLFKKVQERLNNPGIDQSVKQIRNCWKILKTSYYNAKKQYSNCGHKFSMFLGEGGNDARTTICKRRWKWSGCGFWGGIVWWESPSRTPLSMMLKLASLVSLANNTASLTNICEQVRLTYVICSLWATAACHVWIFGVCCVYCHTTALSSVIIEPFFS